MSWRPHVNLIEGELDDAMPGKVTGWIRFVGMDEPVRLELLGDFPRSIRGTKIRFRNPRPADANDSGVFGEIRRGSYMDGFSQAQTGKLGDMTAGLPTRDHMDPYLEWFSDQNGRVVLTLKTEQVVVMGDPARSQKT